jgi:GTP cyclohydrolase II
MFSLSATLPTSERGGRGINSKKVRIQETSEIPADARLPTDKGEFRIRVFNDSETGMDHVALTLGEMKGPDPVLVRVHSECLTGDAFGSLRCDCGPQLDAAIRMIQDVGWGCILYLRQEGRGIGLHAKIQAYNLQDKGADTVEANILLGHPADARDYGVASEILGLIGIESVCLLTNNPDKIAQLVSYGINVEQRMPLVAGVGDENREYLAIKVDKMGHDITTDELNGPT